MSYGEYPYENNYDHLYGIDEQEDRWEQQYADYLEDQIEAQYAAEMDAEYAASMNLLEETILNEGDSSYDSYPEEDSSPFESYTEGVYIEPLEQDIEAHQLLHLPLGDNDAQAATVGEYLGLLLSTLWLQADGFSAKRPFGNSDWQYVVYMAMVKAGLATGVVYEEDGFEYLDEIDEIAADEIILQAIRLAYAHGR